MRIVVPLAVLAAMALGGTALAGGTSLDERDHDHEPGPSIVGWVRQVSSIAPIEGARVTADSKVAPTSLVTRTDPDGAFRFSGLGEDFPISEIEISCASETFTMVDLVIRRLSKDPNIPIEVECVMQRK